MRKSPYQIQIPFESADVIYVDTQPLWLIPIHNFRSDFAKLALLKKIKVIFFF